MEIITFIFPKSKKNAEPVFQYQKICGQKCANLDVSKVFCVKGVSFENIIF